jgi:hypothetical protein
MTKEEFKKRWESNDDIIRMAQEADDYADMKLGKGEFHPDWHDVRDEKFAELVAALAYKAGVAAEREACVEACQNCVMYGPVIEVQQRYNQAYWHCVEAIRAREANEGA